MTTATEPNEDRLDRVERILAETADGLAELRAVQAETAAAHEERMTRIEAMIAANAAAIAEQGETATTHEERLTRIEAMIAANAAAIAEQGERMAWLSEQQQRTNQDMSVMKGWQTEFTVERRAGDIFSRLSPRGSLMRIYPKDELAHYISRGTRADFITRAQGEDAAAIDFLMEGTDHAGAPVVFAIEVSYTAGLADIERAVRRAPLLAKMLGREVVLPAVAAEVISEGFEERARDYQISWAYVPNGNRIMQ